MMSFVVSGLVHEYNFFIHNYVAYVPGQAIQFFCVAGVLMMLEEILPRLLLSGPALKRIERTSSFVICFVLILPILPFFEKLFFSSWLEAGMIDDVIVMFPHLRCFPNPR